MVLLSHWRRNSANRAANSLFHAGINSRVRVHRHHLSNHFALIAMIFLLLAAIAGCVISPRRTVIENPSPTPTPSPTATPTPSITPTPTPAAFPTPTPMAAEVPRNDGHAQFLFTTAPNSVLVSGFKVNIDGSLAPVAGSPFLLSAPARAVASANMTLIVEGNDTVTAFAVDKETGSIQQSDSLSVSTATPDLSSPAMPASRHAVLDANGRFMYVVDASKAELTAYQIEGGKLVVLVASYPVPEGTSSIALVQP
jgi:hypothetical protein